MDYLKLRRQLNVLHKKYCAAKARCNHHDNYKDVEFRFKDFNEFVEDIGLPPTCREITLDRKDPKGHYEPGNIRWATQKEQNYNRKLTEYVEWEGQQVPFGLLCEEYDMKPQLVKRRIKHNGMSLKEALTTKPHGLAESRKKSKVKAFGESLSYGAWAERTGIPERTLRKRIQEKGWHPERALSVPISVHKQEAGRKGARKKYKK